MSRSVFHWLTSFGWSVPSFVHARAEGLHKHLEIWDAHQMARYHAAKVGL